MPSVEKQLLSIPFARGLSQREDPRWLSPGALLTASNIVHPKTNIIEKRPGFQLLSRNGLASIPNTTRVLSTGKRLGRFRNALVAIGADNWTDAAWVYDDGEQAPVLKDRVPEVYAFPDRVVAGGTDLIWDADTAVCGAYAVHAWLVGATDAGAPPFPTVSSAATDVYYQVENASTGEILVTARGLGVPTFAAAPKLVVCGRFVVLTYCTGNSDRKVYAVVLDTANAAAGFGAATAISSQLPKPFAQNGLPNYGAPLGAYDVCATVGDTASFAVVCETGTTTTPQHITVYKCTLDGSGNVTVAASANIEAFDTTFSNDLAASDGNYATFGTIQSFAIRADATNNEVAVAYAWNQNPFGYRSSAGQTYVTRVSVQLVKWTGAFGASIAAAVDLMGTIGNYVEPLTSDHAPQNIAIERVGQAAVHAGAYKVMFSAGHGLFCGYSTSDGGPVIPGGTYTAGQTTAYIASYLVYPFGGFMTVSLNQPRVTFGVRLASRIAIRNGIGYVVGYCPSPDQGTYFLFADDAWSDEVSPGASPFPFRLVATFAPRLASALAHFEQSSVPNLAGLFPIGPFYPYVLPHLVTNPNADGVDVVQTLLSVEQGSTQVSAPTLFAWDYASPLAYQMAELGENVCLATGAPSGFDGSTVFELGFPYFPFCVTLTAAAGGQLNPGAIASPYVYSYIVVYEWVDRRGQLHRSARGLTGSIDLGGLANRQVIISVPTMGFSAREKAALPSAGYGPQGYAAKARPVIVRLYRTDANGSTFYNVDPTDIVGITSNIGAVSTYTVASPNTLLSPFMTLTDLGKTGTITTHRLLYGDGSDGQAPGSALDVFCPPAFQALIVHKNRLFGIDGSNVWASKAFTTNEGSGFSELLAFSVDDGPGPLTAIASLDDKVILWKRDRLFFVSGDGPNDQGGQNDWSVPQRIASDVGCVDWRSVVVTSKGVHFMSDAGMRILTRDLQVLPVVEAEDAFSANPAITSAIVHPTKDRVRWTANADDTSTPRRGLGIDHDYVLDSWMTSIVSDGATQPGAVSAAIAGVDPVYHQLRADGTILRESTATSLDGAIYAPLIVETAWVKTEGLTSFARFRRLMVTWENRDAHQLSAYVAFDFSPTYYLLGTVTAAQMAAMATPLCQELFALPRQRASAVRFKLVDAPDVSFPPVTGRGPRIVELALEWSAYTNRRLARLPGAQRA